MAMNVVRGADAASYGIGSRGVGGGRVDSGHRGSGTASRGYQLSKAISLRVRWRYQRRSVVCTLGHQEQVS